MKADPADQCIGALPEAGLPAGASVHRRRRALHRSCRRARLRRRHPALDPEAKQAGVLVVSGASTVPALSAAVMDAYAPQFAQLDRPASSFRPATASIRALPPRNRSWARSAGRSRCPSTAGRSWCTAGSACSAAHIPGLGRRWLGACDTPDLDLLPQRYPGLRTVEVFAALEVGPFHLALWGLSWLVRAGLLRRPERLAAPLLALKRAMRLLGSDVGGMVVTLEGEDHSGERKRVEWRLIARRGHGPFIPAMPSVSWPSACSPASWQCAAPCPASASSRSPIFWPR